MGNGVCVVKFDINDWYEIVKINYGVKLDGSYDFLMLLVDYVEKDYCVYYVFW